MQWNDDQNVAYYKKILWVAKLAIRKILDFSLALQAYSDYWNTFLPLLKDFSTKFHIPNVMQKQMNVEKRKKKYFAKIKVKVETNKEH